MLWYSKSMDEAVKEAGARVAENLPLQGVTVIVTRCAPEGSEQASVEQIVDVDIASFEKYFCGELKNSSLSRPEIAIIKTWLHWKLSTEGGTKGPRVVATTCFEEPGGSAD